MFQFCAVRTRFLLFRNDRSVLVLWRSIPRIANSSFELHVLKLHVVRCCVFMNDHIAM